MKRILPVVALVFLCVLQPAFAQVADPDVRTIKPVGEDADSYFFTAWNNLQAGDKDEAEKYLNLALKADSTFDMAYCYLGILYAGEKKAAEAEKYYRKAVSMDPANFWYKYYLALFYADTDRPELTADIFKELVGRYPKNTSLYFSLANIYVNQGETDKAIEMMDKIEAISGKNEVIGITGTSLRLQNGDKAGAMEYLKGYYKDCPTPKIAVMLGDDAMASYKEQEAWDYYDQAIQMDSGYSPAYYGRAHADQALRRHEDYFRDLGVFMGDKNVDPEMKVQYMNGLFSQKEYVQAFPVQVDSIMQVVYEASPSDTTVCFFYSYYLFQNHRGEEAVKVLQDNIIAHPDNFQAKFELLIMYYYLEDWDNLLAAAGVLVEEYPGKVDLLELQATARWKKEDYEGAIECYRKALKVEPKDSTVQLVANSALGDLYHEVGNAKLSYKSYERALKVNPSYNPVLNNYAYYLSLEKKHLDKAYRMSKITVDSEPDNPTYLDTFGWILYLKGRNTEAKAIFKHAMLYGGRDSAAILDHYAEVLYSMKEYELAYIYWNQADAADPSLGIAQKIKERKAAAGR